VTMTSIDTLSHSVHTHVSKYAHSWVKVSNGRNVVNGDKCLQTGTVKGSRNNRQGGETGRRTGLKIRSPARGVWVRFPSLALMQKSLEERAGILSFGVTAQTLPVSLANVPRPRMHRIVRGARRGR
jgi:hypothetical protein